MYIFFCEKCKIFDAFKSKTGNFKCPNCGGEYLSLGVTVDEWNEYSNDEMLETISKAKKSIEIKRPRFDNPQQPVNDTFEDTGEDDFIYETIHTENKRGQTSKKKTKTILLIAIISTVVIAVVICTVFLLKPKIDTVIEAPQAYDVSVDPKSEVEDIAPKAEKADTVEKSIEPYTLDQLTEYAENKYNELKKQGYNLTYEKDPYGTGMIITYSAIKDDANEVSKNPAIIVGLADTYLKIDSTIRNGGEPIVLYFYVMFGAEDAFPKATSLHIKGGDSVIDLSKNIYTTVPDPQDTLWRNEVYAQYIDNFDVSEGDLNAILELSEKSDFSYRIQGMYTVEDKLPNDYGKNLKALTELYKELHNLYNGISVE